MDSDEPDLGPPPGADQPDARPQDPSISDPGKSPLLGEIFVGSNTGDRFYCPRCGYARPLKFNEDGFRIYILHEQRCNPVLGGQVWLPFITEDDVIWSPEDDKRAVLPRPRDPVHVDQVHEERTDEAADQNYRKAA